MKLHWLGLIAGGLVVGLALVPGLLPHNVDVGMVLLSGMLLASYSILGFDLPFPRKQVAILTFVLGSLILICGVLMVLAGHTIVLYIVGFPSLGLILFGLREVLEARR
jgi:hypothetical protein